MNAPDLCRPFYHRRGSRIDVCKPILLSEEAGMPAELRARSEPVVSTILHLERSKDESHLGGSKTF
jgi:hypothetical protein